MGKHRPAFLVDKPEAQQVEFDKPMSRIAFFALLFSYSRSLLFCSIQWERQSKEIVICDYWNYKPDSIPTLIHWYTSLKTSIGSRAFNSLVRALWISEAVIKRDVMRRAYRSLSWLDHDMIRVAKRDVNLRILKCVCFLVGGRKD